MQIVVVQPHKNKVRRPGASDSGHLLCVMRVRMVNKGHEGGIRTEPNASVICMVKLVPVRAKSSASMRASLSSPVSF